LTYVVVLPDVKRRRTRQQQMLKDVGFALQRQRQF